MFPASAFAQSPLDDALEGHDALEGRRRSRRWRRALRTLPADAGSPAAPSVAPPVAPIDAPAEVADLDAGFELAVNARPRASRAPLRSPVAIAIGLALVLAAGSSVVLARQAVVAADRADRYQALLDAATTRTDQLVTDSSQRLSLVPLLQGRLKAMHDRISEIKSSKVHTVVKTKVVTQELRRWVPNGRGIQVDTTGFEGRIAIHDVQLTHAYGYSHLIGIAINRSGETVSYAQLGCTFVDADGRLLANEMVNKATWAPGQSWGFDCNAQVDGSGGTVRVDEMS